MMLMIRGRSFGSGRRSIHWRSTGLGQDHVEYIRWILRAARPHCCIRRCRCVWVATSPRRRTVCGVLWRVSAVRHLLLRVLLLRVLLLLWLLLLELRRRQHGIIRIHQRLRGNCGGRLQ